jgi:hypothetical protein
MPIYKPGKTLTIKTREDRENPDSLSFQTRALSYLEQIELQEAIEATEAMGAKEADGSIRGLIEKHITGWSSADPFSVDAVLGAMNLQDVYQLLYAVVGQLSVEEKKS